MDETTPTNFGSFVAYVHITKSNRFDPSDDSTKYPGFNSQFHYISVYASTQGWNTCVSVTSNLRGFRRIRHSFLFVPMFNVAVSYAKEHKIPIVVSDIFWLARFMETVEAGLAFRELDSTGVSIHSAVHRIPFSETSDDYRRYMHRQARDHFIARSKVMEKQLSGLAQPIDERKARTIARGRVIGAKVAKHFAQCFAEQTALQLVTAATTLRASGRAITLSSLAKELGNMGIRPRRSLRWSKETVRRLLIRLDLSIEKLATHPDEPTAPPTS